MSRDGVSAQLRPIHLLTQDLCQPETSSHEMCESTGSEALIPTPHLGCPPSLPEGDPDPLLVGDVLPDDAHVRQGTLGFSTPASRTLAALHFSVKAAFCCSDICFQMAPTSVRVPFLKSESLIFAGSFISAIWGDGLCVSGGQGRLLEGHSTCEMTGAVSWRDTEV